MSETLQGNLNICFIPRSWVVYLCRDTLFMIPNFALVLFLQNGHYLP